MSKKIQTDLKNMTDSQFRTAYKKTKMQVRKEIKKKQWANHRANLKGYIYHGNYNSNSRH